MKIVNFGSLNIDYVFTVDHIARPGETIASSKYQVFAGGKGNNQSIAISRAGGDVLHFGKIGRDGLWLVEQMKKDGVNTETVAISDHPSGSAMIQVDQNGQNAIVLFGGSNLEISKDEILSGLEKCHSTDWILIQNEISHVSFIIEQAHQRKIKICFNPAPMGKEVLSYPLQSINLFIINETEGQALTGAQKPEAIINCMCRQFPCSEVILTLGKEGVIYANEREKYRLPGEKVTVVDSTAAGDTFIGYFLAALQKGSSIKSCLELANKAAALSVTQKGAVSSIPYRSDLNQA